jgi:hypothetical protein
MRDGHTPGDIDEYPWRDVQLYMAARPAILAAEHPLAEDQ